MAKPRIFVSSTYYDLRTVRSDIENSIRDWGYEPVLNEKGHIPYSRERSLEEACLREIGSIDILVSIVGNRFGANSADGDHSISQQELRTAIKLNKQVFIFVDRAVQQEHRTFELNRGNEAINYSAVDDPRIFHFLDDLYALASNNAIFPFETSSDITTMLREQLAGLFRDMLIESSARQTGALIDQLTGAITSLREITGIISKAIPQNGASSSEAILPTHPLFAELKKLLKVRYRVFFLNKSELTNWLSAREYTPVNEAEWDDPLHMEFLSKDSERLLKIAISLFRANGRLINIQPDDWTNDMATLVEFPISRRDLELDEEIPF